MEYWRNGSVLASHTKKTYSMPEESKKGFKKSKDRVTALLLVNADGSERLLVVVGKSREPRCFRGIKNLPI